MRIEFGDIRLGEEAQKNLIDCVKTNWISGGPKVKKLETLWSKLFSYKHSVAMANGTDADTAACMVLYEFGAKRGDEIIVPALAFIAAGNSILAAGFKPIFVDIDKKTLNINPDKIEEKVTDKTVAIMAVHTMGKPCEMDKINEIAKKNNLIVIEDSCEAHGAKYKDKFIGTLGDMATFSYYIAHLICCGEGGMVSTNSSKMAGILESVKSHGRKPETLFFDHIRYGLNFKMNDLEASIGLSQIPHFWEIFNKRKENLYYLLEKFKDLEKYAYFNLEEDHEVVCPHAFSITLKDPKYDLKKFHDYLLKNEINCKRNFGCMPTQHKAFEFLGHKLGDFPEAEYVGDNGLHFGIHQYLSKEDLDYISEVVHEYFKDF